MDANELRIGNYILLDNKEYWPEAANIPMIIKSLTEIESLKAGKWTYSVSLDHLYKEENTYYDSYSQFIKFLKPIPLTEEWLLNLGCIKTGDVFHLDDYILLKKKTIELCIYIDGFYVLSEIEYVHQLQNLYFALKGKELCIKSD